jgi:TonB family protein
MFVQRLVASLVIVLISSVCSQAAEQTTAVWSDGHTSALSDEELTRNALTSPGPGYPRQAQEAKIAGNGVYELRVSKAGTITEVAVVKSSGNAILDNAAKSAFLKWRFKPAVFTRVRLPVSWSVNRVP